MAYPSSLDELTDGVPADNIAATTAMDNATYPHDDHHRALATAVEAVEAELGTDPAGASATVKARLDALDTTVAAKVPASLVDAAGDLLVGSAADTVARLAMGTASQVLQVNSGATGLEYATPSSGGGFAGPILMSGTYAAWSGNPTTMAVGISAAASGTFWTPFPISRSVTVDRIGVHVTTDGGPSSTLRMGIYSAAAGGGPGALVLDAGTVSCNGTGFKEITVSQALTPGLVWLCAVRQGNADYSVALRATNFIGHAPLFLSSQQDTAWSGVKLATGGPTGSLPDPATAPDTPTTAAIRFMLRIV